MRIKVLPDNVINKIAAGEVVERPSSVIRELIDNAIDAQSTQIDVYLEDGGKELIRIVDNGYGMEKDDALLAFERHATSKISQLNDLEGIGSLGFRGEALPSIAAVAKIYLKSKTKDSPTATVIEYSGGKLTNVTQESGQVGTIIEVSNLFFNVPVRKKFLKSARTEEQKVKAWIQQTALAYPNIQFRLFSGSKEIFTYAACNDSLARAKILYPSNAVQLNSDMGVLKVRGLLAHPSMSQRSNKNLAILVNGRVVSDRLILRAIKEGFSTTLKYQEFPVGFVELDISPVEVDVNVHPQKSEVRFTNPQKVFVTLRDLVSSAIQDFKTPLEASRDDHVKSYTQKPHEAPEFHQPTLNYAAKSQAETSLQPKLEVVVNADQNDRQESQPNFLFRDLQYIGQAFDCYLFCELVERLYIVDMHAAHERYNFNLVKNKFAKQQPDSQVLLLPVTVEIGEEGVKNCLEHSEFLSNFGFEIEKFGPDTLIIRAVPSILNTKDLVPLIKEIAVSEYLEEAQSKVQKAIEYIAARIACHASLRSGDKITSREVYELFTLLDSSEFSSACPHGRPIIVEFAQAEVEAWFGRT